jgi:uncharacterized protein (DUF427 family)
LEPVAERITVSFAGETIADTIQAIRVLETSHPPVYYLPPEMCARICSCQHTAAPFVSSRERRLTYRS